jgi:hypothetical protein
LESFNKIININDERKKSAIPEQSTELTTGQLTQYIDTAVNDLDGWVDRGNLNSLKTILTNLRGKTYQGKPALNAFLDGYKLDEHGDDFINDVSKIGTNTFDFSDFQIQKEVIKLAQSGSVSSGTPQTKDGNLSGVQISWGNGGKVNPVTPPTSNPTPVKPTSKYHDCTDFPFQFGCRSNKIKEVQTWLNMPPKYQTGNFGPLTLDALRKSAYDITNKVITQDMYNQIYQKQSKLGNNIAPDVAPTVTTPLDVPSAPEQNLAENVEEIKNMFKRIL